MTRFVLAFALALVAAIQAPAPARAEETYRIDSEVWGYFQEYLRTVGNRPGAFAITTDGHGSYYLTCPSMHCIGGTTYGHDAKERCESYGDSCVVFAVRRDIRVQYEIRPAAAGTGSSAPDLAPAPTTKVAVPAAVQAEIDTYLSNAKSGGKAWALAIAKDGSEVAAASCLTTGGGGYLGGGGACNLVEGSPQDLANREAIKRCGGPADCVLLYVGRQKTANIEIVAQ